MKFPLIVLAIGALALIGGIASIFVSDALVRREEPAALVAEEVATTMATTSATTTLPIILASPAPTPSCNTGVPDPIKDEDALKRGEITLLTKETVIQAVARRDDLFRTAEAPCIRTYFRTGMVPNGEWNELDDIDDEKLIALARLVAALDESKDMTTFRAKMLGPEAEWSYEDSEMKVGFTTKVENGSTTNYITANYKNGIWF